MPFKISPTVEEVRYPKVNTYADLPTASDYTGEIYVVLTATGVWGVSRKRTGMWRSDGVNWGRLGVAPTAEELGAIASTPPSGSFKIYDLRENAAGNLEYEKDDTPAP